MKDVNFFKKCVTVFSGNYFKFKLLIIRQLSTIFIMTNIWSDQQLKAAIQAGKAATHYKRAAEYYEAGNAEKAIHHALVAVDHIDQSAEHAQQANEYCFSTMMNDTQKF